MLTIKEQKKIPRTSWQMPTLWRKKDLKELDKFVKSNIVSQGNPGKVIFNRIKKKKVKNVKNKKFIIWRAKFQQIKSPKI